jgi:hypothetical protein
MADPTAAEVQAALAILAAAEAAREAAIKVVAVPAEPVKPLPTANQIENLQPVDPRPRQNWQDHVAPARAPVVPPADDAHVAVGSSLFSDPSVLKTAPVAVPPVPAAVVPAAPTQPVNALAALDADVATYSEVASRLSSLRSSLVGLSEHDARQLHAANYAKVLSTMRKQNLLP